jgi:hypothetical protein
VPRVTGPAATASDPDPVEVLRRWEASGAVWRVVGRSGGWVTVALLTCDAGEQVGQVRCEEDQVRDHLAGRSSSDEG